MAGRKADLVVSSGSFDLAVLRYSQPNDTLPLKFASGPAKLNSDVTIAGFPLHGWLGGLNVSRGAVSSLKGLGGTETTMQITAPIQPGNSGGPTVNSAGAVVGVVVSKLDAIAVANEIGDVPENVGFAVRGEIAQLFLSSNGINFEKNAGGDALTSEQLADHLQRSTVLVECLR